MVKLFSVTQNFFLNRTTLDIYTSYDPFDSLYVNKLCSNVNSFTPHLSQKISIIL